MAELLNHLVGCGEQRRRDVDTELFRCLEIDDQLEPGGLHELKVRRRFTFKDAADIDTRLPPCARQVGTVADKTSKNGIHSTIADRRNSEAVGHCDVQPSSAKAEQWIGAGEKRAHLQPAHRFKSL